MKKYLLKRILMMIPTLLGVALVIFLLIRVIPGDIVELRYAREGVSMSEETLQQERELLGLDKPLWIQFGNWMWGLMRGDPGVSMWTGQPIIYEIKIRFELTLQLAIMSMVFSVILGVPLGMIAALKQDTWVDYAIRVFSIAGLATPSFWLGIIIIMVLLNLFNWAPPMEFTPLWKDLGANLAQLIWPAMASGYRFSSMVMRMTRSTMIEVLREDYIRTARAKGLFENMIIFQHGLRNALLPIVSVVGLELAFLLGGLVVTEQVFNLNGLGLLLVKSISQRDYMMIQSLVVLVAFFLVVMNFALDILFATLDPRVRYK